ncbi:MAG: proline racemase family protein [Saprospiraceae bacterium]|nr:proline racemase family protein [Saprospiraceae bacterium]
MSELFHSIQRNIKGPLVLPDGEMRFQTVDLHTCGEPLRVILSGIPSLRGSTILQKRSEFSKNYDHIRRLLMYEPRGHADMYGCILVEPEHQTSDLGVIFMHNEGYSTMCGHATIALTKLVAKMQWAPIEDGFMRLVLDVPCGEIRSTYDASEANNEFGVSFEGVPSFVLSRDLVLELPGYPPVTFDIAYGGAFYAYVDADLIGLPLDPSHVNEIIRLGRQLKASIIRSHIQIEHPLSSDLSFLYGVIFRSKRTVSSAPYRNVCVFADGEVDRSPTGSGLCGFMALLHHKGLINNGDRIIVESIIGSRFRAEIVKNVDLEGLPAVIPSIAGNAYIISSQNFILQHDDPLREGFILR